MYANESSEHHYNVITVTKPHLNNRIMYLAGWDLLRSFVINFFSTSDCPSSSFLRANLVWNFTWNRRTPPSNHTSPTFPPPWSWRHSWSFLMGSEKKIGLWQLNIASAWKVGECLELTLHKTPRQSWHQENSYAASMSGTLVLLDVPL